MSTDRREPTDQRDDPADDQVDDQVDGDEQDEPGLTARDKARLEVETAERNPDPVTRREALELELMDEGRSEAGEEIGDEAP